MVRYFFRLSYMGTKYKGIQRCIDCPMLTIQEIVEHALTCLKLRSTPVAHFASRTDKGVHAIINAFHVDLDHKIQGEVHKSHDIMRRVNNFFMENNHDIVITSVSAVHDNFHARKNAKWRSYYYRIAVLNQEIPDSQQFYPESYLPICELNRCHAVASHLNTSTVRQVVNLYRGEHDFSTFTKYVERENWRSYRRVIDECRFYPVDCPDLMCDSKYSNFQMWEFYVKAKSFLYHQVRKLVGAALSAGFGRLGVSDVQSMLDNPHPKNWTHCKLPPACGLYLAHIHYDPKDFSYHSFQSNPSPPLQEQERSVIT